VNLVGTQQVATYPPLVKPVTRGERGGNTAEADAVQLKPTIRSLETDPADRNVLSKTKTSLRFSVLRRTSRWRNLALQYKHFLGAKRGAWGKKGEKQNLVETPLREQHEPHSERGFKNDPKTSLKEGKGIDHLVSN